MGKLKLFLLLKQEQGFSGKCSETMLPPTSAVLGSQTREQLSESFFGLPRPNDWVLGSRRRLEGTHTTRPAVTQCTCGPGVWLMEAIRLVI